MPDPTELKKLASWYRVFAERAENPVIWEARVITADNLDREADRILGERAKKGLDHSSRPTLIPDDAAA